MALMRFLKDIYIDREAIGTVLSKESFLEIFKAIAINDNDFTVDNYKPGTSGESALYKDLKNKYFGE